MAHELGMGPSSTSWGSQVRVLHRPFADEATAVITADEPIGDYQIGRAHV